METSRRPFDRIDCELLAALQKNARLSNKELAAKVGLSASSCLERVRRLFEEGSLVGAWGIAAPAALGIGLQAIVSVRLRRHSQEEVEAFRRHALGVREVIAFYHLAGPNDFLLHVAVRDPEHLRRLAMSAFTTRPEVAHIETSLVYDHKAKAELPNYRAPDERRALPDD